MLNFTRRDEIAAQLEHIVMQHRTRAHALDQSSVPPVDSSLIFRLRIELALIDLVECSQDYDKHLSEHQALLCKAMLAIANVLLNNLTPKEETKALPAPNKLPLRDF